MENLQEIPSVLVSPQPETPKKKRKVWPWVLVLILLLLLAIGAVGYYLYTQQQHAEKDYQALARSRNIELYEDFLEKYPRSEYASEVRSRLRDLQMKADAWNAIVSSSNPQDFVNFKMRFKDGYYDALCNAKIDSIDWVQAQRTNTPEAYLRYREMHPDGKYVTQSYASVEQLANEQVSPLEQQQVRQILQAFFNGFGNNDEMEYCRYITPVMDAFLNKPMATKTDVVKIISGMFNENIYGCEFSVSNDLDVKRAQLPDGTQGLLATFTLDQRIERDDDGRDFGTFAASAMLNSRGLITSLSLRHLPN